MQGEREERAGFASPAAANERRQGEREERAGFASPAVANERRQGTVATFDPQTRAGTLLLDDGAELEFPAAAFDASGLRLLRLGQRVRVDRDDRGRVTRVTLATFD
jgi:cold shock CspA family protein